MRTSCSAVDRAIRNFNLQGPPRPGNLLKQMVKFNHSCGLGLGGGGGGVGLGGTSLISLGGGGGGGGGAVGLSSNLKTMLFNP